MKRAWSPVAAVAACASTDTSEQLSFDEPRAAVPEITALLRAKDWPTLARCYDLRDSEVKRADLESGEALPAPARNGREPALCGPMRGGSLERTPGKGPRGGRSRNGGGLPGGDHARAEA